MSPRPIPIHTQELLQHANWLASLASGLVGDAAAAEDVVQDTYLAALRKKPDASRDLTPWLARVARNFAKKRHRGEGRRTEREQVVARPDAVASPDAILERLELQRVLAEELQALDEPWRSAVVLRYVEGHTSVEIARLLGVPDGTVRWRLKRALDELRTRLDRRFGGSRETWSVLLVPLALRTPEHAAVSANAATGSAAIGKGLLAASVIAKLCVLLALVLAAGSVWWGLRGRTADPAAVGKDVARMQPSTLEHGGASAGPGIDPSPGSARAAFAHSPSSAAGAGSASDVRDTLSLGPARVEARFVDANGNPLSDVSLESRGPQQGRTESGHDGRAVLQLWIRDREESDGRAQLVARRSGSETRTFSTQLHAGETSYLGDVKLRPAGTLDVLVVDGAGLAVAGVDVWTVPCGKEDKEAFEPVRTALFGPLEPEQRIGPEARTDVDGHAHLAGVGPGDWRVIAGKKGWRSARSERTHVPPGETAGVSVEMTRLLDTDWIAGRVIDPDGAPVEHPLVRYTARSNAGAAMAAAPSNERGEFELLLDESARYDIVANDRERRFTEAVALDVRHGEHELVLQLGEPRFFAAHVEDDAGHGIDGAVIVSHRDGALEFEDVRTTADVQGQALVAIPRTTFRVTATADGYRPAQLGPFETGAVPADLRFELTRLPVVRGTVRKDGEPVVGARVELREFVREGTLTVNRFPCRMQDRAASQATTDAEGRFTIAVPREARYFVRATAPGFAPAELGPLDLGGERSREGADIALGKGGTIVGRVIASDGRDTVGTIVAINHGDGHPVTKRAGPGGVYRFEGLATGLWQVNLRSEELRSDVELRGNVELRGDVEVRGEARPMAGPTEGVAIKWSCEVFEGRTTVHDLELH